MKTSLRKYYRDYYAANRDRIRAQQKRYARKTLVTRAKRWREAEQKLRREAVKYYGHKCKRCGDKRYEVLTFDHINGGGHKHRKQVGSGSRFVRWLRRNGYPKIVQLLCWNCNAVKAYHKDKF